MASRFMSTSTSNIRPLIEFTEPFWEDEMKEPLENPRQFYIRAQHGKYWAEVSVKWVWPKGKEPDKDRRDLAESVADEAFGAAMFAPNKIINALRGKK